MLPLHKIRKCKAEAGESRTENKGKKKVLCVVLRYILARQRQDQERTAAVLWHAGHAVRPEEGKGGFQMPEVVKEAVKEEL